MLNRLFKPPSKAQGTLKNRGLKGCKSRKTGKVLWNAIFWAWDSYCNHEVIELFASMGSANTGLVNSQSWMVEVLMGLTTSCWIDGFWVWGDLVFSWILTSEPTKLQWVILNQNVTWVTLVQFRWSKNNIEKHECGKNFCGSRNDNDVREIREGRGDSNQSALYKYMKL